MSLQTSPDPSDASATPSSEFGTRVRAHVARTVVGQEEVVERVLIALLTGGHLLLEGVPGIAKTLLVSSVASAIDLDHGRIQFTIDLLPSDILGSEILDPTQNEFRIHQGPIFTNLLLADEINRTPPKTQAALLEAMQERQVSAGGETLPLPNPFFVLATQNPIEQEGTYPLPEAALDRFLFLIQVDYPSAEEEAEILRRTTGAEEAEVKPVLNVEQLLELQKLVRRVPVADPVLHYAVSLARRTRPAEEEAPAFIQQWITWGAGPRASQNMILAAKAHALLRGRFHVATEDIDAVAPAVLRHRILTNFAAQAEGITADDVIKRLIEETEAHPSALDGERATGIGS